MFFPLATFLRSPFRHVHVLGNPVNRFPKKHFSDFSFVNLKSCRIPFLDIPSSYADFWSSRFDFCELLYATYEQHIYLKSISIYNQIICNTQLWYTIIFIVILIVLLWSCTRNTYTHISHMFCHHVLFIAFDREIITVEFYSFSSLGLPNSQYIYFGYIYNIA